MDTIIPVERDNKFAYDIIITHNFLKLHNYLIKIKPDKACKICIVTDDNVAGFYLEEVKKEIGKYYNDVLTYTFLHGEENKTLDSVSGLYQYLINEHFCRSDFLVALGGGVIGDMTGFAAATFLRGVDFIQIPTTLLSQVDSSIGGKTGVDFMTYKNMIGAFYMPKLVYINTGVLKTLPQEQFSSGMGEVIKYGLIQRKDFYFWLSENADEICALDEDAISKVIEISCRCKKEVVEIDPTEKGIRAHLNFGHTIGHAIEKMSDFSLFHGHCVGLGMIAACDISRKRGFLTESEFEGVYAILRRFGMPTSVEDISAEDVLLATKSDKKMVGNTIRFILLSDIGHAFIDKTVTDEELAKAIAVVVK